MYRYIVQQNDSLASIAQRFSGDVSRVVELINCNPQIPRVYAEEDGIVFETFDPNYFAVGVDLRIPDTWINANITNSSGSLGSANNQVGVGSVDSASWETARARRSRRIIITGTTLAGNVAGGAYAYHAKGGFWWTVLGVIVGGIAGNLTGRLVTVPLRH